VENPKKGDDATRSAGWPNGWLMMVCVRVSECTRGDVLGSASLKGSWFPLLSPHCAAAQPLHHFVQLIASHLPCRSGLPTFPIRPFTTSNACV
jgi:hypothetical protein